DILTIHVPTSESSGRDERAPHCPDTRQQPKSRDKCWVSSLMDRAFRSWAPDLDRAGLQRLESHDASLKIENNAKVSKKITAQNPALKEARGFIYRLEIEHGGIHLLARIAADGNLWEQGHLHIFSYAR